jgi:hypothetical protein
VEALAVTFPAKASTPVEILKSHNKKGRIQNLYAAFFYLVKT